MENMPFLSCFLAKGRILWIPGKGQTQQTIEGVELQNVFDLQTLGQVGIPGRNPWRRPESHPENILI